MPTPAAWHAAGRVAANVNLNTITEVRQPRSADEIVKWRPGYAWLAGGTWLFSTPQIATDTLIDLRVAALAGACSCPARRPRHRRDLHHRRARSTSSAPADWTAAPLFQLCCHAPCSPRSRSGTRRRSAATSACRCRPAPMISLATALEGRLHAVAARRRAAQGGGASISSPATTRTCSQPGELLRSIHLPARALAQALRLPPLLADPSRPLGRAPHRHAEPGRRRSRCSPSPRRRQAGAAQLRPRCRPPPSCATPSTRPFRPTAISTTCMARRPIGGSSPITIAEQIRAELANAWSAA